MTSARRAFASRANGRLSKGPRTAAGLARRAGAAVKHGLNLPLLRDPGLPPEIDALARKIITSVPGLSVGEACHPPAARIAEAMIDLYRVRLAKRPLSAALDADPANMATLKALTRLDRYERRALARRKFAIREFSAALAQSPAATGSRHFGKTS